MKNLFSINVTKVEIDNRILIDLKIFLNLECLPKKNIFNYK